MKLVCQIDTGAFAGVMIVLVLTMLFANWLTPTLYHHSIGPDQPRVSHSVYMMRANGEHAIVVSILHDGNVYFGSDKIPPNQIESLIRLRLQDERAERKVYIRADRRVYYRNVKNVLDGVRNAGIEKIAFLSY